MSGAAIPALTWDNKDGPEVLETPYPGLTPSREGLAVKATRPPCSVEGCEKPVASRTICGTHYANYKRNGLLPEKVRPTATKCAITGCDGLGPYSRGWCRLHYRRWADKGDANWTPEVRTGFCQIAGCDKKSDGMDICQTHRARMDRTGSYDLAARNDRYTRSDGYVLTKVGHDHMLADHHGWAYEHRLVVLEQFGPDPQPCNWCGRTVYWELTYPQDIEALVVDHLDDNKSNNHPSNLVPSCNPCNVERAKGWKARKRK